MLIAPRTTEGAPGTAETATIGNARSAAESGTDVTTLLVTKEACVETSAPRRAGIPNGAGDLLAGLLLGRLLDGQSPQAALAACIADVDRVLAASAGRDVLQLWALRR